MKIRNETDENKYNEMQAAKKSKAVRHLLLIRHGQYNLSGETDSDRVLTDLGLFTTINYLIISGKLHCLLSWIIEN